MKYPYYLLLALLPLGIPAASEPAPAATEPPPAPVPDMRRVKEIAAMLPEKPGPLFLTPITDRAAWDNLPEATAKGLLETAEKQLAAGIVPFTEEGYFEYLRTGSRTSQNFLQQRTAYLRDLLFGECIENQRRFLPAIEAAVQDIGTEKTWTKPSVDPHLEYYYGKKVRVDLNVAARALLFTGVYHILGDKLSAETRALIKRELSRRVFEPYRRCLLSGDREGFWWTTWQTNWNAVCNAGIILPALAMIESREDRAFFLHGTELNIHNFLDGVPEDGYCTEGIGYWDYGFGNYVLLATGIKMATGGRIDWFDNPKVVRLGRFGRRMNLIANLYPAYADCAPTRKPDPWIMYYMDRLYDPASLAVWKAAPINAGDPYVMALTCTPTSPYYTAAPYPRLAPKPGDLLRDFFDQAGILNCRPRNPDAPDAFAVSLKGNHNEEAHNHNDLGTFVVATRRSTLPLIVDPGGEVYTVRTFSTQRYESKVLNSYGHSVPVIGGQLQRPGRDARAKVVETTFSDTADRIVFDLTSAYSHIPGVRTLTRAFVYTRTPTTLLTVTDVFSADTPLAFGSAIITFDRWQQIADDAFLVFNDREALEVRVDARGAAFEFAEEIIAEELSSKRQPRRIGINLTAPVTNATVTLTIRKADIPAR
jgi:hypothetical protein